MINDLFKAAHAAIFPSGLRFINYALIFGCKEFDCNFCLIHKQRGKPMTAEERREAFRRLQLLSANDRKSLPKRKYCKISIMGGEPADSPELIPAVIDGVEAGFSVNVVSSGDSLTEECVIQLTDAGLDNLHISVDLPGLGERDKLERALELLGIAKARGVIPAVNVLISRGTDIDQLKRFCQRVIDAKCFVSLLTMSPKVNGGIFSNAPLETVPTNQQLREITAWLAYKKTLTGFATSTFGYLNTLLRVGRFEDGETKLWHCARNFRGLQGRLGRGYVFLGPGGELGPCQEFLTKLNILEIAEKDLTIQYLDQALSGITWDCPGCGPYNCYDMEEELHGWKALAEIPTALRILQVKRRMF